MDNFLENPEEKRVELFSGSFQKKIKKMKNLKNEEVNDSNVTNVLEIESDALNISEDDSFISSTKKEINTVQIRISRLIEQKVKDKLLSYYIKTGKKISFREYADNALFSYLDFIEK